MADIATVWRDFAGDWLVSRPGLADDDGLHSSIVISLFTDRLAEPGDPLPDSGLGSAGRRGWWADAFPAARGDLIGSRLWLLAREKALPEALRRAEGYATEALQWLIDDGVARSVAVTASALPDRPEVMALEVVVVRSAAPQARYRFEHFWKGA